MSQKQFLLEAIAINAYLKKKKKKTSDKQTNFTLQGTKKRQTKPKISRRKGINKGWSKNYEIETRKIIGRSTKPGPDFWER